MSYWDSCRRCGRKRVALVFVVQGLEWRLPWRTWDGRRDEDAPGPLVRREPRQVEAMRGMTPVARRGGGLCLLTAECEAIVQRRKVKQEQRGKLPKDATLKKLHKAERGRCKWCGERVYRVNKNGHVVVDLRRMWHLGRTVHPDAEPEPDCLREYSAQGFTFRDQVGLRDKGVCASCGRDCEAERRAWESLRPSKAWDAEDAADWYSKAFEERDAEHREWLEQEPVGWQADHIVPLEDDGEHLLANAQTLCGPCHVVKTARENSERARRRNGDTSDVGPRTDQMAL